MGATLSQNGFNFLKTAEGYSNVAYTLKGESYPTVGFGHHSRDLIEGKRYSDTECMNFFKQDSKQFTSDVNKIWHTGMTQSMFDAMFSLAYNHGNISSTALGSVIKGNGYQNRSLVTSTWQTSYINKGTRQEKGLRKRRIREANLFYSEGYDGNAPAPVNSGNGMDDSYYDQLAGVQNRYSSNAPSVLSTASANIYSELTLGGEEDGKQRTRIYKYSDPTIQLDELSIPLDGNNTPIDLSTGMHYPAVDSSTSLYTNVEDIAAGTQKLSGSQPDITLEAGATYPIIRINDHYFSQQEIDYMEIACVGFIPTIRLDITTINNDLLKTNVPKEGDKISVFCSPGHGMIKSLRCDFLITFVESNSISQYNQRKPHSFSIMGELFIPNLHNANMSFSFAGTSRDALIDAANKLGLGFFFCDPENTDDNQLWYCMAENSDAEGVALGSNLRDYIQDTAAHAWKNFESFFDVWIDPRYGLTFLNVNKMLGESGPDETFDITLFNDVFTHKRGMDNQHGTQPDSEKKTTARPQLKLITNIPDDDEVTTPLYATDFYEINQAAEITKQVGISVTTNYVINNQGVEPDNNAVEMTYSIPYNADKYPNGGFYILIGPGTNGTYVQADTGSYVQQNAKKYGGRDTDMMADSDGEVIADTGSNEMATGNVNKFYDAAFEHNKINNMQLLKKLIKVKLNGANFAMMRGEKIPTLFLDNDKLMSMFRANPNDWDSSTGMPIKISESERRSRMLNACTYTTMSGWFIIKSIKWTFTSTPNTAESAWQTELELTRREWPIPGYMNVKTPSTNVQNNITPEQTTGNSPTQNRNNQSPTTQNNNEDEIKPEDNVGGDVPLTGLKDFMKDIYKALDEASVHKVKLVGARRYAVDENGDKIAGNAFVKSGDKFKCKDAKGNIMYVGLNNSRHFYGEAIDVINNGMEFEKLFTNIILGNGNLLKIMYDHGVSAYIEISEDDMGTISKHIHIGTDLEKQKEFWQSVKKNFGGNAIIYNGGQFTVDNYIANNNYREGEIQLHDTIFESIK